jgi:hypothetical protein
MPYCPQCGIDNPASARFCDQCGAALIPVAAAPAATALTATLPPVAGPIICPQCGTSAIPGEAFCDNCGAPLSAPASTPMPAPNPPYSTNVPAQPVYPPPQPAGAAAPAPQPQPPPPSPPPIFYSSPTPLPAPPPGAPPTLPGAPPTLPPRHLPPLPTRVALAPSQLVVGTSGAALPLPNSPQAVVGRADAVSKFYPDIDLTPHGALDNGVGRKHLRLFIQAGQIMAEDEDSTNGTLINGQKLAPRQPQPLHDGDQIQLGKLLLRFQL